MRKPKFEIFAAANGGWSFRLKAPSGSIILVGRTYKMKSETLHAIASVMRYGHINDSFVFRKNAAGKLFFQLKSPSGRLLGWSNYFDSIRDRDVAIRDVKSSVLYGRVLDGN